MQFEFLGLKDRQLVAPSREGAVDVTVSCLSAEGATRSLPALWASLLSEDGVPRPYGTGLLIAGPPDLR